MDKKPNDKKITLTEEQASRAAETILNAWLRGDGSTTISKKDANKSDKK